MMLNFDFSGNQQEEKQDLPPDEYLISVFDPLAPTKFVDPHAADKGTKDLNRPQMTIGTDAREARNITRISIPGSSAVPNKNVTIENMFTK